MISIREIDIKIFTTIGARNVISVDSIHELNLL